MEPPHPAPEPSPRPAPLLAPAAPLPADLPPDSVRQELAQLLSAPAFAGASSQKRLLRHLVEQTLAGQTAALKESVLGIEVFQRPAQAFDPRRDSIVRVEARRLRQRLRQHYAALPTSPLTIVLPTGGYVPQFIRRAADDRQAGAAELVERGRYFLRLGHEDGHRKALDRFEAAAQAAPGLAAAFAGVARARLQLVSTNLEAPQPGIGLALAAVHRALSLRPGDADSLVLAAQITHRFEYDWPAAQMLFERAQRAAPAAAPVQHALAFSRMLRGEFDAAADALEAAHRIDPLHLGQRAHQALLWLYRRDWDRAEDTLHALLDLSADNVLGLSLLAYVALCRGDAEAALALYTQVATLHPRLSIGACGRVWALATLGREGEARQRLSDLRRQWADGRYLSPYQLAMAECRLDDRPAALSLLQRAVDERDPNAVCLPVDPAFDALAGEPLFRALRAQVLGQDR